jgi:hypothetical protein
MLKTTATTTTKDTVKKDRDKAKDRAKDKDKSKKSDDAFTLCGYELTDVRKSLCDAINRRDSRSAYRWTAELIATPRALGSLFASYWQSWAITQSHATIPILLKQTWELLTDSIRQMDGDWAAFRNDPQIRRTAAEMTLRLIEQPRTSIIVWPTKDIILYDISQLRSRDVPVLADSPFVMDVWQRNEDVMDLRVMAGHFLTALESWDLRIALSIIAWSLMSPFQQGLAFPLKAAERGPAALPVGLRRSPLWFWFEIGGAWIRHDSVGRGHHDSGVGQKKHPGWLTAHTAIVTAMREHFKRWSITDRMRILLAWVLHLRNSVSVTSRSVDWSAPVLVLPDTEVDIPYKELAIEIANPDSLISHEGGDDDDESPAAQKRRKAEQRRKAELKLAEADAEIFSAMGLDGV